MDVSSEPHERHIDQTPFMASELDLSLEIVVLQRFRVVHFEDEDPSSVRNRQLLADKLLVTLAAVSKTSNRCCRKFVREGFL